MTSPNYQTIRQAILALRPISFSYGGYERLVCPHVIGWKNGLEKVLTFQYGGGSSSGLGAGGQWRCLFVSELSNISFISGAWHSGTRHSRPQSCVDLIDVQVFVGGDGVPYIQTA
jgi:hypothetical protein